jgi:tetratricopeptide (TPR) repeat protein
VAATEWSTAVNDQPDLDPQRTAQRRRKLLAVVLVLAAAIIGFAVVVSVTQSDEGPSAETLLEDGLAAQLAGDSDSAEALYLRLLRIDPDNVLGVYNLGVLRQSEQRPDEAATFYRRALELDGDMTSAQLNLAWALRDLGDLDGAVDALRDLQERRPDDPWVVFNLGQMLIASGEIKAGADLVQRAIELDPSLLVEE